MNDIQNQDKKTPDNYTKLLAKLFVTILVLSASACVAALVVAFVRFLFGF